jgi:hypothetical protein
MTTEKHDPWALLREAKRLIAANRLMLGHYSGVREVGSLEDRIDAALAERQDSAKDSVEWKTQDVVDYPIQYAERNGAELVVFPNITEPSNVWHWKTIFMGEASTEAEARRAATAAARGMK